MAGMARYQADAEAGLDLVKFQKLDDTHTEINKYDRNATVTPEPVAVSIPEAVAEPVVAAEAVSVSDPVVVSESKATPVPEPVAAPAVEVVSVSEPVAAPVVEAVSVPEPVAAPAVEAIQVPESAHVSEHVAAASHEPDAAPHASDPARNDAPVTVHAPEPATKLITAPVVAPAKVDTPAPATGVTVKNSGVDQSVKSVRLVEDWPDLYTGGVNVNSQADGSSANIAQGLPLQTNEKPSSNEPQNSAKSLENNSSVKAGNQLAPAELKITEADEIERNKRLSQQPIRSATEQADAATPIARNVDNDAIAKSVRVPEPVRARVYAPVLSGAVKANVPEAKVVQVEKMPGNFTREPNTASSFTVAASTQGGALLVDNKPSNQELTDRAAYWEKRGRSDLAAKVRSQIQVEPKKVERPVQVESKKIDIPVSSRQVSVNPPNVEKSVQSSIPQVTSSIEPKAAAIIVPTIQPAPRIPLHTVSSTDSGVSDSTPVAQKPSRDELADRAQYWESRGRTDLASQIRQKLQSLEPKQISNVAERPARDTQYHAESTRNDTLSALEDSLLKNPNSLKARLDLAQIYRSAGEIAKARLQIASLLLTSPDLPEALFASAQLYADQRLWLEAMHTLERVSPVSRTPDMAKLQKMSWAHLQLERADALVRQGNNEEAEILLRQVAVELAVNYNQTKLPEPPPLWKNEMPKRQKKLH
ncbi:MAG: hypothetical protein WC208_03170 [Gallionella sp.]